MTSIDKEKYYQNILPTTDTSSHLFWYFGGRCSIQYPRVPTLLQSASFRVTHGPAGHSTIHPAGHMITSMVPCFYRGGCARRDRVMNSVVFVVMDKRSTLIDIHTILPRHLW